MATGVTVKVKKKKPSVLKRIRSGERKAVINRANRTRVRTAIKQFRAAVVAGDQTGAQKLLAPTMSAIDRAIQKGVLVENTANRYKSRLTLAFNAMGAK